MNHQRVKLIIGEEMQEREQEISGVGSSPGGSFPSLSSSQSSGDNKMIPYVSPIGKVRVLKSKILYLKRIVGASV